MRRFRLICCPLSLLLGIQSLGAVRGEHASYVGGTVTSMKKGVQGALDMSDLKTLRFEYEGGEFMLPYRQIATLESGQKVGRRVGAALAGVAMIGLIPGLIILSSKKKKHYLTIGYRNEAGEGQAVVFELAKSTVSSILPTLETRTGLRVELEAGEGFEEIGHAAAPHIPPPPPPPVVPKIATIMIQANPPGAEVVVDAQTRGSAPTTVSVRSGSNYIVIRKDGFENWTREIQTKPGESVTLSADLKAIQDSPNVIVVRPSKPAQ